MPSQKFKVPNVAVNNGYYIKYNYLNNIINQKKIIIQYLKLIYFFSRE